MWVNNTGTVMQYQQTGEFEFNELHNCSFDWFKSMIYFNRHTWNILNKLNYEIILSIL